jgi:hypothetical protein
MNAKEEEEKKAPAEIESQLEKFAELLDPHLSTPSEVKDADITKRWSARKAAAIIIGTSLIVWALVLLLGYYLL